MYITVKDIERARNRIKVGDYVLESRPVLQGSCRKVFTASRVVQKSRHVFVTEILGTAFPGVRTSYSYADLLLQEEVKVVPESQAVYAAKIFAMDRVCFPKSA